MEKELSLAARRKIYYCCVKNNKTMIDTSKMLNLHIDAIRQYMEKLFLDPKERLKVTSSKALIYPEKRKICSEFTGYYMELTEEDMLVGPMYDLKEVSKEDFIYYPTKVESFTERFKRIMDSGVEFYKEFEKQDTLSKEPIKGRKKIFKYYIVDEKGKYFCYNTFRGKATMVNPNKNNKAPVTAAVMTKENAENKIFHLLEHTPNLSNTLEKERKKRNFNDFETLRLLKKE